MSLELKVLEVIKTHVIDKFTDYVKDIRSYDKNMDALQGELEDLCNKKLGIDEKVKSGTRNLHKVTREAAEWLERVRRLTEDEALKKLMVRDAEIAKLTVQLMELKVLKKALREDIEMRDIVVRVARKINDEGQGQEIARVVVNVMKSSTEEFKRMIKEDTKMAIVATRLLDDEALGKLKMDDQDMAEVLDRAGKLQYEEFLQDYHDDYKELAKGPSSEDKNVMKQAAAILVKPLRYLLKEEGLNKALPHNVKLGLEVMDALSKIDGLGEEIAANKRSHSFGCDSVFCFIHHRCQLSRAAKLLAERIQKDIIGRYPPQVTVSKSPDELKQIPSRYMSGLESRDKLLKSILDMLKDGQLNAVGVFGMGGSGKTILVKEVANTSLANYRCRTVITVEISDAPNIERIQDHIAEGLGLSLQGVQSLPERARRLYNSLTLRKPNEYEDDEGSSKYDGARLSPEKKQVDSGRDTLIILDNVWQKLNLDEVGIPHQDTKESCCKLLVTSRERNVCIEMGIQSANIIEVGTITDKEAWVLFQEQVGRTLDNKEYKYMAEKLLAKCGRLPVAVVGTANALKGKELSVWRHFVQNLQSPILNQVSGVHQEAYSVFETSFKLIESRAKQRFFLLACLFPPASCIPIEDLMRYGIGLGLFENVNCLAEAMELAKKWAQELVSSSLLLKDGGAKGCVRIHDVVRSSAISFAPGGYTIMVEGIPEWMQVENCRFNNAMSLMPGCDHSRLDKIKFSNLEILLLNNSKPSEFPDSFFEGMTSLKVLVLSNMNFEQHLPTSMIKLHNLRTLLLEDCKLGDIWVIAELVNLVVLSLRRSDVKQLPEEIWRLHSLCLLDLTGCSKLETIPPYVISCLSQLGGLYMRDSFTGWADIESRGSDIAEENRSEGASIGELTSRSSLNVLEMHVNRPSQLPTWDDQFVGNLHEFSVSVGHFAEGSPSSRRALTLGEFDLGQVTRYNCLKVLLKKTDFLQLVKGQGLKHIVPGFKLGEEGFWGLKRLLVQECSDMECIISARGITSNRDLISFPKLKSIRLSHLNNLKMICDGLESFPRMLSKLRHLSLEKLQELRYYLLPVNIALNLTELYVKSCDNIEFIFMEHAFDLSNDGVIHEFPDLKELHLDQVSRLKSMLQDAGYSTSNRGSETNQPLFNRKIKFPSLETLKLNQLGIAKLWDSSGREVMQASPLGWDVYVSSFRKLKVVEVKNCKKLKSLCSASVAVALDELESLYINNCSEMLEVITNERDEIGSVSGLKKIGFPNLKHLTLSFSEKLKTFYSGSSELQFPALQVLDLCNVPLMTKFSGPENSDAFFDNKTELPSLEKLKLWFLSEKVNKLWLSSSVGVNASGRSPAPELREISLLSSKTLLKLEFPTTVLEKLSTLKVELVDLFQQSMTVPGLLIRPSWSKYKGLRFLRISRLRWDYVFDSLVEDDIVDAQPRQVQLLPLLEELEISGCKDLKWVVTDHQKSNNPNSGRGVTIVFPRLRRISIWFVFNAQYFSSLSCSFPSLQELELRGCDRMKAFLQSGCFITVPALSKIKLEKCNELLCLFQPDNDNFLDLPSLTQVKISECSRLQSLSSQPVGYFSNITATFSKL